MADQKNKATYTRRLSREIDDAYEAYKAGEPNAERRLYDAFVAQARNVARYRLDEMYDYTVAYDAVHRAMQALSSFRGDSRLSTWFIQVALNEAFREQGRLLGKRDREESINRPVHDGEPDESKLKEIAQYPPDQALALDRAKLRRCLSPEQAEVLDRNEQGYTVDQIAEMKGLNRSTVGSRLRLAKRKLEQEAKANDPER